MSSRASIEKKLNIPQVKKVLNSIGEENLDQFQRRTLDYVNKFSKTKLAASKKLLKKLTKEFDLEETEAVQVINCMPQNISELRVFLAGGRKIIETAKLEAIIDLLNDKRKAEDIGIAGRKRIEELFSIEKNVENIEVLYEKILVKKI